MPGIQEYAQEFTTEDAFGEDGYLVDKGLIPLPDEDRAKYREATKTLPKLVL